MTKIPAPQLFATGSARPLRLGTRKPALPGTRLDALFRFLTKIFARVVLPSGLLSFADNQTSKADEISKESVAAIQREIQSQIIQRALHCNPWVSSRSTARSNPKPNSFVPAARFKSAAAEAEPVRHRRQLLQNHDRRASFFFFSSLGCVERSDSREDPLLEGR